MFKDLENYFDLHKRDNFLTLITGSTVDGSFLLHHLLSSALRVKQQVYFFNIAQTWAHYKSVQTKLGNATILTDMTNSSKLINFELMNLSQDFISIDVNDVESRLKEIFSNLKPKLTGQAEKVLIVIDDLSVLNLIGCSENFILEFMNSIGEYRDKVDLVVYLQSLQSNIQLVNEMKYLADSYVLLDSLMTGYAKDIQGQVKFLLDFIETWYIPPPTFNYLNLKNKSYLVLKSQSFRTLITKGIFFQ